MAAAYARVQVRAFVDVPLVRDGQLIALLYVHHAQPRRWTSVELATIRAVCERLWDAVEHGRTLAALHASEERLEQAMTAAGFGAWDWSAQTRAFQVSASFRPVLGIDLSRVRTWEDMAAIVHPDDRSMVEGVSADLWSGRAGDRFDLEFRSRADSDAPRWLVTRGAVTERSPEGGRSGCAASWPTSPNARRWRPNCAPRRTSAPRPRACRRWARLPPPSRMS
ncbi:GAF domain-containing protein [Sphingomonas changnyeongensis]|uniref:GAF domain-containing protein n=1 Tax=Sphingomonas changnyeongensis TaxID=2698679 RepID=A0A7Z2NTK4_9SPHN|nr:GAF domain-containing protein [Sphingomonas changnyeongensis]QHL89512.1 GAF domain-containing protein [Sphingomonas changnyeongensis]